MTCLRAASAACRHPNAARPSTLVALTEYNRNVMRLQPPLIVTEVEIQRFVEALDAVLARGVVGIVSGYAKGLVSAG